MKILIFNDSQSIEVQAADQNGDYLHVRMIHTTPEELKTFFLDEILTSKMTLWENGKELKSFENFTTFSYIKEEAGGIYEVEMIQEGKDPDTRLQEVEETVQAVDIKADETINNLQMAIAELSMLIAAMMPVVPQEGGTENV